VSFKVGSVVHIYCDIKKIELMNMIFTPKRSNFEAWGR